MPGEYDIPADALWLTTDDTTIGSGLATTDEISLYEDDAASLVSTFMSPWNPGNAISDEIIDLTGGDTSSNWQASACDSGSSPGQSDCP